MSQIRSIVPLKMEGALETPKRSLLYQYKPLWVLIVVNFHLLLVVDKLALNLSL